MAEKFTDIEMKPLEQRRRSFAHQHQVLREQQQSEAKGDEGEDIKLKAPFSWHLLEEFKYSIYIKRFFRFIAIVNILALAVNGPAVPGEYLQNTLGFCENTEEAKIHFIVLLTVDIILSILYTLLLYIRVQNSRYWHKLRRSKVL